MHVAGTVSPAPVTSIILDDAQLEIGDVATPYKPGAASGVSIQNPISPANVGVYIENTAIKLAQIDTASIGQLSALSATIGTLRTTTTGQRMELTSAGMKVFNSDGTAVITLGIY